MISGMNISFLLYSPFYFIIKTCFIFDAVFSFCIRFFINNILSKMMHWIVNYTQRI